MCSVRLAQHKQREGAGAAYLEDALVAGKGLGRRSPSRRPQGDQERVSLREKEKVREEKQEGGDEPEALSG